MRLKLVSLKDTLLGHVDVPDYWRAWLERSGAATTPVLPRFSYMAPDMADQLVAPNITKVTLVKAGWSQYREAVWLAEGKIEELETIEGCSFTPSMAYLRSQLL